MSSSGTDQYGENLHCSMYYGMWVNDPKEVFEYDDYTYEEHFGKLIPSYVTVPVIRDYLEGNTGTFIISIVVSVYFTVFFSF